VETNAARKNSLDKQIDAKSNKMDNKKANRIEINVNKNNNNSNFSNNVSNKNTSISNSKANISQPTTTTIHNTKPQVVASAISCLATINDRGATGGLNYILTGSGSAEDSSVVMLDARKSFQIVNKFQHHTNGVYSLCIVGDACLFSGFIFVFIFIFFIMYIYIFFLFSINIIFF
jgi:hypothetical protein